MVDVVRQNIIIDALEESMVKMFRLCQSLFALAKQERQLLVEGKASELTGLSEKKIKILDELGATEKERKQYTEQLARFSGVGSEFKNLTELLNQIDNPEIEKLFRLQEGILTLQSDISEINNGNYALASLNLQHLEAVQDFIVNIVYPSSSYYGPEKERNTNEPPKSIQMDHRA